MAASVSEVDFADVFGGPPRRFSTQEYRYSFGGEADEDSSKASPEHDGGRESSVLCRNPWTGLEEKPVFGSNDVVNRRRFPSYDFYDDIFRGGDDSHSSSPRKSDQHPMSSSPARSLPLHSDPFATSFPSQFSLPAKSTRLDFSKVSSNIGSDEASSSSPARQKDDDFRSETLSSYRPSPLSQEYFVNHRENKSDEIINNNNTSLLHFSIYKWASKGAPLSFVPLFRSNSSKSNRNYKMHRCSSSNGRIQDGTNNNMAEFLCQTESPEIHKSTPIEFPARRKDKDLNDEEKKGDAKSSKSSSDDVVQRVKLPKNDSTSHGLDYSQRRPSSENLRRNPSNKGDGMVKDFVKIFNQQEESVKPQNDIQTRTQSFRWKQHVSNSTENLHEKQNKIHSKSTQNSFRRNDPSSDSGSLPNPSTTINIEMEDLMEDNFQVKELPNDHGISTNNEDLDNKIRQWARGKEGNIRSLLSTLQFVLWENSGWKPVALVDIIEGNAVKRAYQRALLYLHPDKLQQKCSAPHQKYIAEKVFKILQEAWDHFNTLGAL
ncbi:J domain-containing protein required for chloroplast accumulation response 1-like isoform X2 [Impatiens glandulifera]|uniref:J domain-containing protein required for chloroplast accumulation response 1-like isoform X2 n=1 Tax=Impatiens glandulifera TaxID=253017 RepID=UPI001FB18012|nr:J domain-containing protein required for chloroplast accumulation response 1-like isoform X2 [Impatiens glandulifera]